MPLRKSHIMWEKHQIAHCWVWFHYRHREDFRRQHLKSGDIIRCLSRMPSSGRNLLSIRLEFQVRLGFSHRRITKKTLRRQARARAMDDSDSDSTKRRSSILGEKVLFGLHRYKVFYCLVNTLAVDHQTYLMKVYTFSFLKFILIAITFKLC